MTDWATHALCRGPLASWWDDRLDDPDGQTETGQERRDRHGRAKAICAACPVAAQCAAAVTDRDAGVWAGRLVNTDGCEVCGCAMVRKRGSSTAGVRRHAAGGRCNVCWKRAQREAVAV